jgi:hypothetical protein
VERQENQGLVNWQRFTPADYEYDFEQDELAAHSEKTEKNLTEQDIDEIVVAQANDDARWEKPIRVRRSEPAPLAILPELVARAAFLAQLHRTKSVEEWLARVVQERIELEEAAFFGIKQELATKTT